MNTFNNNKFVNLLSLISVLVLLWLMIFDVVPVRSWSPWGFLGIFLLIAFVATSSNRTK